MKRLIALFSVLGILFLAGCQENDRIVHADYNAPSSPIGLSLTVSGSSVILYWDRNTETDIEGYNVYYSSTYSGVYKLIGSTQGTSYTITNVPAGATYYFAVSAFDYNNNESRKSYFEMAPARPAGLYVVNGNGIADVYWTANKEATLKGYKVYTSNSYNGKYTLLATVTTNHYIDQPLTNGTKYYYAVSAYDIYGDESDLSTESVYSAPRPEGINAVVYDYHTNASQGGYDLYDGKMVSYTSNTCDFYFDIDLSVGKSYLVVASDTDIQDMGATRDIYDINYAPSTGWNSSKDAVVIQGHTYVIRTFDKHYAKVRVSRILSDRIVFDWAFQLIKDEPSLRPSAGRNIQAATTNRSAR